MYVMGVINSRRLGKSLGIDIIGADGTKRCNFNCVYCEVGNGRYETNRGIYADFEVAMDELMKSITPDIDVITFSGNGEPTLNIEIGKYIDEIHKISTVPVCVITNSSLLGNQDVVDALMKADIVMPSIDSCIEESFIKTDRPYGINLTDITKNLIKFCSDYKGKLFLETLFVKGLNDSVIDLEKILELVQIINPTEFHINTIDRAPAEDVMLYTTSEKDDLSNYFSIENICVKIY